MAVYLPPTPIPKKDKNGLSRIFLAGSIEQGKAEDWQNSVINKLKNQFDFLNPRRQSWDASWVQSIENPQFKEQVEWELDGLETVDLVLMYFAPETKSPISLLELGLMAKSKKMIVVCPDGFWRKGNVEIVCDRFEVPLYKNLDIALDFLGKMKN